MNRSFPTCIVFLLLAFSTNLMTLTATAEPSLQSINSPSQKAGGNHPEGIRVTLESTKSKYFLGETMLFHLCITNESTEAWDFVAPLRNEPTKVHAFDIHGQDTPSTKLDYLFGGMSSIGPLKPQEEFCLGFELADYRYIVSEGNWRIRAIANFEMAKVTAGSNDTLEYHQNLGKLPIVSLVAEVEVPIELPTQENIEAIFQRIDSQEKDPGGSAGKRHRAYEKECNLTYPAFLPRLIQRAKNGNLNSFCALGHMPTIEAGEALVNLLGLPQPHTDEEIYKQLAQRTQQATTAEKTSHNIEQPELLNFPPLGKITSDKLLNYLISRASYLPRQAWGLFGKLAEKENVTEIIRVVTLKLSNNEWSASYFRPEQSSRNEFDSLFGNALDVIIRTDFEIPLPPNSEGEYALLLARLRKDHNFRPNDFQQLVLQGLSHSQPYIRELSIRAATQLALWDILHPKMKTLLADGNIDVVLQACEATQKLEKQDSSLSKELLPLLRYNHFRRVQEECAKAAIASGYAFETFQILVDELCKFNSNNEWHGVGEILKSLILKSSSGGGRLGQEDIAECKIIQTKWRTFLAAEEKNIRAGKRYNANEHKIFKELYPGWEFNN